MNTRRFAAWSGLVLLLFVLYGVDVAGLGLAPVVQEAPLAVLAMAAIDAAVLWLALGQARGGGRRLATAVFLLYFGVKAALVAVEALYLPDVLPPEVVRPLLINGLVTALLTAPAAVWLRGKWEEETAVSSSGIGWFTVSWRLVLAGFIWMVLFVATGLLVFRPIATALDAATATAYLAAFEPENPMLVLGFQWARGILWGLLALPWLWWVGNGRSPRSGLVLGALFAGLMGSGLVLPNELLPASIQPAHLAEVMVENLVWGLVLVRLFARPQPDAAPHHLKQA